MFTTLIVCLSCILVHSNIVFLDGIDKKASLYLVELNSSAPLYFFGRFRYSVHVMSDSDTPKTIGVEAPQPNREFKDSIFVDLLTYREENIRQVCKALGEKVEDESIELLKLENTVYTGLQNDVSCLIGKRLMMLIEHQSTINPNMPMRCFQYAGRLYENIIPKQEKYSTKVHLYPNPECYTFYNGDAPYPERCELRLSDLFKDKSRPPAVELIVKVFNINYSENNEFLKDCPVLYEYALFVDQVKKNKKDGRKGYDRAVNWALKNGILEEYLNMRCRVLSNMLISEYDPELHMKVRVEEGKEEGREEGKEEKKLELARSFRDLGVAIDKIMQATGLSKEEIESL